MPNNAISITVKDNYALLSPDFCPLRHPGPHVPYQSIDALTFFELLFDDRVVKRLIDCTFAYAESKKSKKKKKRYELFMKKNSIKH